MLFTMYVSDQQTAHRLTLDGAKDAAAVFIAKGGIVRIEYRARHDARRTTWYYDAAKKEWSRAS